MDRTRFVGTRDRLRVTAPIPGRRLSGMAPATASEVSSTSRRATSAAVVRVEAVPRKQRVGSPRRRMPADVIRRAAASHGARRSRSAATVHVRLPATGPVPSRRSSSTASTTRGRRPSGRARGAARARRAAAPGPATRPRPGRTRRRRGSRARPAGRSPPPRARRGSRRWSGAAGPRPRSAGEPRGTGRRPRGPPPTSSTAARRHAAPGTTPVAGPRPARAAVVHLRRASRASARARS